MHQDPSIKACAEAEANRLAIRLAQGVANREGFYRARERIMAEEGHVMAAKYGKQTAQMALAMLGNLRPVDIPASYHRDSRDSHLSTIERVTYETRGDVIRYRPLDRWLYRYLGFTLRGPETISTCECSQEEWQERQFEKQYAEYERQKEREAKQAAADKIKADQMALQARLLKEYAVYVEATARGENVRLNGYVAPHERPARRRAPKRRRGSMYEED